MSTLSMHGSVLPHPPEDVFRLWANPATWPSWDSDVTEVRFEGTVGMGAQGWMRPASGPATTFVVTAFEPDRLLNDEAPLPGARLIFEHAVTPTPEGSDVTVAIKVEGFLAPLWGLLLRKTFADSAKRNVDGLATYLDSAS